jgi:cytochrome c5
MNKTALILALSFASLLAACGKQESAPETAAPAAPEAVAQAPAAVAQHDEAQSEEANEVGRKAFGAVCSMCHASGTAGAPRLGDQADWGPRIAQGMDVLYKHSLEGFTGEKGMMPARGGSTTISDDDVKAAVDYMVAKAK